MALQKYHYKYHREDNKINSSQYIKCLRFKTLSWITLHVLNLYRVKTFFYWEYYDNKKIILPVLYIWRVCCYNLLLVKLEIIKHQWDLANILKVKQREMIIKVSWNLKRIFSYVQSYFLINIINFIYIICYFY